MFNKILIFLKAQISAFLGGAVDYVVMVLATELLHIHYTISIAIGGVIGAIVNFSINRKWTFFEKGKAFRKGALPQFLRFCAMVANSIILKSSGTYLLTTFSGLDYKITRLIVDGIVSLGVNFTLQKYWVFSHKKARKESKEMKG